MKANPKPKSKAVRLTLTHTPKGVCYHCLNRYHDMCSGNCECKKLKHDDSGWWQPFTTIASKTWLDLKPEDFLSIEPIPMKAGDILPLQPIPIKAGDRRVLINGEPVKVDFRIISEENYQYLIKRIIRKF